MASSIINRQYSDLDLNFTIHPVRKDINRWTDEQAVIHSVRNLLVTNHYERPFQPEIGSNIRRLISNFEPRVTITTLQVAPNEQQNAFGVYMEFEIINRTEPITIRFLLQRIR